jgi:hypothetical protein
MLRIDEYNFGFIVINGRKYWHDILLYPDGTLEDWWRKEGHIVERDDIESLLNSQPDILILGTGATGLMKVPPDIRDICLEQGVELIVETTADAVNILNDKKRDAKMAAGLPLSC